MLSPVGSTNKMQMARGFGCSKKETKDTITQWGNAFRCDERHDERPICHATPVLGGWVPLLLVLVVIVGALGVGALSCGIEGVESCHSCPLACMVIAFPPSLFVLFFRSTQRGKPTHRNPLDPLNSHLPKIQTTGQHVVLCQRLAQAGKGPTVRFQEKHFFLPSLAFSSRPPLPPPPC